MPPHRTAAELEAGLASVRGAPDDHGTVRLVVRRPATDQREIMDEAELDVELGLVGDGWIERPMKATGRPDPTAQVCIMNARYTELLAGSEKADWALAGDQLYLDIDLSQENLPAGSRIAVGSAVLEIAAQPHTGCAKFSARFGTEALRQTSTEIGRQLRLRGANTVIVTSGIVRPGDEVRKV